MSILRPLSASRAPLASLPHVRIAPERSASALVRQIGQGERDRPLVQIAHSLPNDRRVAPFALAEC
jgi:hypothetical protein